MGLDKKGKIMADANTPDLESLSPEEQAHFKKYVQLPKKRDFMTRKLQGADRKRFDSADFEMQKKQVRPVGAHPLGGQKPKIPDSVRAGMMKSVSFLCSSTRKKKSN